MHKGWMVPVLALALACTVTACGMDDNGAAGSPGTGANQSPGVADSAQQRMMRSRLNTDEALKNGRYQADSRGEVKDRGDETRDLTQDARDMVRDAENDIRDAARDIWD